MTVEVKNVTCIVLSGRNALLITCADTPADYAKHEPVFEAIVNSFSFDAGASAPAKAQAGAGTGTNGASGKAERYVSEEASYSIELPAGWVVTQSDDLMGGVVATLPMPAGSKAADAIIQVSPERYSTSPLVDDIGPANVRELPEIIGAPDGEPTYEHVRMAGRDAVRMTVTLSGNGRRVKNVTWYLTRGHRSYAVACWGLESRYEEFAPVFEKALQFFRLEAEPGEPREPVTYRDEKSGYEVRFPAGWATGPVAGDPTLARAISPLDDARDSFKENVRVYFVATPARIDMDAYTAELARRLAALPGYKALDSGSVTIDGRDGRYASCTNRAAGREVRQVTYVTKANGGFYSLTFSDLPLDYDSHRYVFDQILASFKIIDRSSGGSDGKPAPSPQR